MYADPRVHYQVMYLRARRVLLLPFGIIAFAALAAGMSLFTLTSASFYWFGVPTVFLMVYLGFHCELEHA